MQENTKEDLKINYRLLLAFGAVIFLSAAFTIILFAKANRILNQKIATTAEANRPANLNITVISDKNCADCYDLSSIIGQISKENIKINSNQNIDSNSAEGKQLVTQFGIKKLPTFLITGELAKNAKLAGFFSQAGDTTGTTFVFRQVGGPYVDTATGQIKGRTNLVMLIDVTCTTCYDVTEHEAILKQFGMQPTSKVVDIKSAEGIALKNKYGIKLVPTFVLTGDVGAYPDFKTVWPQVGVIAYDGAYIFTKGVPSMGVYKDLTTNKVITPAPATNQQ